MYQLCDVKSEGLNVKSTYISFTNSNLDERISFYQDNWLNQFEDIYYEFSI